MIGNFQGLEEAFMTPEVKFLLLIQINYEEACQECSENLRGLDPHSTGFPDT